MMKEYDCVEMKRKAQEIIYSKTKKMSEEEKFKYWVERDAAYKKDLEEAGERSESRK